MGMCRWWKSDFVPVENLILLAAGTIGALKAADEENCHSQGNQNGQHAGIRSEPMNQGVHNSGRPALASNPAIK